MKLNKCNKILKAYFIFSFCISISTFATYESHGQTRFLNLEMGQGLLFEEGKDPYSFSFQIHPTLGFEENQIRLGLSLAPTYLNPSWNLLWGSRVSLQFYKFIESTGNGLPDIRIATIHITGKALLKETEFIRLSGGIIVELLDGLLQISPQYGYDRKQKNNFLEISFGTDFKLIRDLF